MSSHTYFYPEGKVEQVKISLSSADLYEAGLNLLGLFRLKAQCSCLSPSPVIVPNVLQGIDTPFLVKRTGNL